MVKLLFSLFNELIFTRREEYDFQSKHFKPGKVIFASVIILMFVYAFLITSVVIRTGVKHMELTEQHSKLQATHKELVVTMAKVPKPPEPMSSDNQ